MELGLTEEQSEKIMEMNKESLDQAAIRFGVENALIKHKAKNIKAVSALIDFSKISGGEDGISGIEEQIEKLKNTSETAFLFDSGEGCVKGAHAEEGKDRGKPKNFRNMTYTEMCKYMG